jgi:hypothetical protein
MVAGMASDTLTFRQSDKDLSPNDLVALSPCPPQWLTVLMLAAIYAIPIAVALRPVAVPEMDPDIWWHLRIGQWVCDHRAIPVTDPCSRYGIDKPWVAYSWLYEVLVYRLYDWFGLAGIVLYRVVMSMAVVATLHRLIRRREPRFVVAAGLTGIAALAISPLFSERPWLFTMLFTILTLDVLLDWRDGRPTVLAWFLPLLFILWANLHIQFVYGLFLLGLACLPFAGWRCGQEKRCAVLGLCLLATLVNPYHVQLYRVVIEYATQPGPFHYVNELRALEFRDLPDWVGLLLGAAAIFVLGRRQRLSGFEVLLLAVASFCAIRARRDLWWLVVVSSAVLARREHDGTEEAQPGRLRSRLVVLSAASLLLAGQIAVLAWKRDLSEENMRRKVATVFPVEAASVVADRGYPGPLFNDFNWGGYLIWSLPQLPVVLDGRTNLHGDERIKRLINTWAAGPGWRDDPDLTSAGVIVADAHSPLGCVLDLDERFQMVHEDGVARVFLRKRTSHAGNQRVDTGKP